MVNRGSLFSHKHFEDPGRRKDHQQPTLSSPLNTAILIATDNRGNTEAGFESSQYPGAGRATFQCSQTPEHRANSYSPSRPLQRRRRFIIANTTCKHRVGALLNGVLQAVPARDTTGNRPICLPSKPQALSIHVPIPASQSLFNRRFHGRLEQMGANLHVSICQPLAPGNLKPNDLPREGINHNPTETDCPLVSCSQTQVFNPQSPRTTLPDRPKRNNKHPIHLLRALGRSDSIRAIFRKNYSSPTAKLLAASYRSSSQRQAEVAWRSFETWLPSSLLVISRSRVLDFLTYLFNIRHLSPRTIMCYRALRMGQDSIFSIFFFNVTNS